MNFFCTLKGGEHRVIPIDFKDYDKKDCWNIGKRIQEVREKKNLKAADIAACLNIGINQYSRIENGRANCTTPQMFVLAQILDCSVDYFYFGKEPTLSVRQQSAIEELLEAFSKK